MSSASGDVQSVQAWFRRKHKPMRERRGYAAVGLVNPKFDANVGGVLRAAECYSSRFVAIQGGRYNAPATDVRRSFRHLPLLKVEDLHAIVPHDCVPIAVDLIDGARSLIDYTHPERAFYIFGPEDSSLGRKTTEWCRDVIYVPTNLCMNLAATVNVVLYDRMAKRREYLVEMNTASKSSRWGSLESLNLSSV